MENNQINVTLRRVRLIQIFYRLVLMNSSAEAMKQYILDDDEQPLDKQTVEIAYDLIDNFGNLKEDIIEKLKGDWKWDRIPAIIRAILIVGAYEIEFTNTDKKVTINEMINIAKIWAPDFDYKFVNAILDKIIKL